jgi:hypothetical protein
MTEMTPFCLSSPSIPIYPNMFASTDKRVKKLTDTAQAALETSTKKRKSNADSIGTSGPKRAKANPLSGNSKERTTEPLSPSPELALPKPGMQSRRTVVRTEEEEAALYDDAIEISDKSSNNDLDDEQHGLLPEEESTEDELSERNLHI